MEQAKCDCEPNCWKQ